MCLFDATLSTDFVKFINVYKSVSSRSIKRDYSKIKRFLWKSAFSKTGYFIITSGGATIETIKHILKLKKKNKCISSFFMRGANTFQMLSSILFWFANLRLLHEGEVQKGL